MTELPLICVDACLALKWALPEDDSFEAFALLREWTVEERLMVAPVFFWAEVGSAARKRAARGQVPDETARNAFQELLAITVSPVPVPWLRAYDIAEQLGDLHLYDACYLAVAEQEGAEFWTADTPLHNRAAPLFPWVHLL